MANQVPTVTSAALRYKVEAERNDRFAALAGRIDPDARPAEIFRSYFRSFCDSALGHETDII